mmetsp:Transcript_2041/g.4663  ORF Transcript_2041/g.4663 Transcript_2041/m.4663 type:complete len:181 (-) Transcript_2041:75-617(-)
MPSSDIKVVVVGDVGVGKTCMLISFSHNDFPKDYVPTVFGDCHQSITVDGKDAKIGVWDTEDDSLRLLSYPKTHVFLIAFSMVSPTSLANVATKWAPELHKHGRGRPIILVGTKADLLAHKSAEECVSSAQGQAVADKINAVKYMECSALTQQGLMKVFEEAFRAAEAAPPIKDGCCTIL